MTDTAIIGSNCPIGKFWSSKRYFDYLIDTENLQLMRNKEFGQVILIAPSLWEGLNNVRKDPTNFLKYTKALTDLMHEVKIERLTFVTSIELRDEIANENDHPSRETTDEVAAALLELHDYINLRFGRVLNIYVPEITGTGYPGMSVVDDLIAEKGKKTKLKVALLERHQLYPMSRIVKDVEKAWEFGVFHLNLVPEPVTTFELVEKCFPSMSSRLPVAKESDPYGSNRTSIHSTQYYDPNTGYIMTKQDVLDGLMEAES